MIGHADANEIKSETAIGDNEDMQEDEKKEEDNLEQLAKYPIGLVVASTFIIGVINGLIAGIVIGMILA